MVSHSEPETVWQYRSTEELLTAFNGAIAAIHATRRRIGTGRLPLSQIDGLARDIQEQSGVCRAITRVLARRGVDTGWRD